MIRSHLYVQQSETPVYGMASEHEEPLFTLRAGQWVGVMEVEGEWVRILTREGEGWMKQNALEERPPLTLHVEWKSGESILYTSGPAA